jgi:hypothetical protein
MSVCRRTVLLLVSAVLLVFPGCRHDGDNPSAPPVATSGPGIDRITPTDAFGGDTVVIEGRNFPVPDPARGREGQPRVCLSGYPGPDSTVSPIRYDDSTIAFIALHGSYTARIIVRVGDSAVAAGMPLTVHTLTTIQEAVYYVNGLRARAHCRRYAMDAFGMITPLGEFDSVLTLPAFTHAEETAAQRQTIVGRTMQLAGQNHAWPWEIDIALAGTFSTGSLVTGVGFDARYSHRSAPQWEPRNDGIWIKGVIAALPIQWNGTSASATLHGDEVCRRVQFTNYRWWDHWDGYTWDLVEILGAEPDAVFRITWRGK